MNDDRDLEKDIGLAHRLGQMPEPKVPADLAARIVAQATQLPQQSAVEPEPPVVAAPMPSARPAERRSWLPYALGGAIAATGIGALLLQPHLVTQPKAVALASPAADPLSRQPKVLIGAELDPRPSVKSEQGAPRLAANPAPAAVKTRRKLEPSTEIGANPAPAKALDVPMQAEAPKSPPVAPATTGPTEQAVLAPPGPNGIVGPMLPYSPSSGLSITGSGPRMDAGPPPPSAPRGPRY